MVKSIQDSSKVSCSEPNHLVRRWKLPELHLPISSMRGERNEREAARVFHKEFEKTGKRPKSLNESPKETHQVKE